MNHQLLKMESPHNQTYNQITQNKYYPKNKIKSRKI